ncbi:MAG: response regulator [Nitrospinota bacterium]
MEKFNILVVDDSVTIQKVFELSFDESGLDLFLASSVAEAKKILEAEQIDFVIADVNIPDEDGYDLSLFIKEDERFKFIPVYLLVSAIDGLDEFKFKNSKADGSFAKPFKSVEMLDTVRSIVEGGKKDRLEGDEGVASFDNIPVGDEFMGGIDASETQNIDIVPDMPEIMLDESALVEDDLESEDESDIELIPVEADSIFEQPDHLADDHLADDHLASDQLERPETPINLEPVEEKGDSLAETKLKSDDLISPDRESIKSLIREEVAKELKQIKLDIVESIRDALLGK